MKVKSGRNCHISPIVAPTVLTGTHNTLDYKGDTEVVDDTAAAIPHRAKNVRDSMKRCQEII